MPTSYYPIGFPASGNNATTGIILGNYMRPSEGEDVAITGVTFDSPVSQTVEAKVYEVNNGDGGSGLPLWTGTGLAAAVGSNEFPFDDPILFEDGMRYLVSVKIPNGGAWKTALTGGLDIDQPPLRQGNNQYVGVFIETTTWPSSVTAAGGILQTPWSEHRENVYGIGVYSESLPSKLSWSTERIDIETMSIDWTLPGDAPDGVLIVRAPGVHVNDGLGRTPADPAYDPSTISGAAEIASGLFDGPFIDEGLDPVKYTYWIARYEPLV